MHPQLLKNATMKIAEQAQLCFSDSIKYLFFFFQDERGRLMRRNIVRYAVLAYVITLKHVSVRVKKRFPTLQHIVDAGEISSRLKLSQIFQVILCLTKFPIC